jgi:hypothetical protein
VEHSVEETGSVLNPFGRELASICMKHNIGTADRLLRALGGGALLVSAYMVSPLIAIPGGYLLLTSLAGTCLGYRMMGRSTCPVSRS